MLLVVKAPAFASLLTSMAIPLRKKQQKTPNLTWWRFCISGQLQLMAVSNISAEMGNHRLVTPAICLILGT
jgi:hypothetical protein